MSLNVNKRFLNAESCDWNDDYWKGSHRVIRINLTTNIASTVAGNGSCNPNETPVDGVAALSSSLCSPTQISLDSGKNLIIVDSGHKRIRRVSFTNSLGGLASFSPSAKDMSNLKRNPDGSWQRTYRDGTQVNFNSHGLQTSLVDRVGRTTNYAYTSDDQISQITDVAGQVTTVLYSGNIVTGIIDPAGRTTTYSYSGNLLTKITFPDGSAKRFEYDDQGLLVKEFNERGYNRTYTYNGYNRVTSMKDFDGSISSTEDQGSASVDKGTLKSYGTDDNLVHDKYVDTQGNESRLAKDYQGFIKSFKDAKGQEVQILRNSNGQIESVVYADGSSEQYFYDPNTQDLIKTLDVQTGIATEKTYSSFGQVLTEKDGRGLITSFVYDSAKGLLIRKVEPGNKITELTYNHLGLVETKKIYPDGTTAFTTTYQYDTRGNLIKKISNDGKEGILTYDLAGNVISSTQKQSSSLQVTTSYLYDQLGRLVKVISPKNEATEYFYSPSGQLVLIKDPENKEVTFEYDAKDRVIKKTDQFGQSYEFSYDSNGNLLSEKDPKGQVKNYAYDDLNQLIQVTLPDDQIFYAYNVKREIVSAENSTSQILYTRNSKNWVTSVSVAGRATMSGYPQMQMTYSYDENGNRTQADTSIGSIGYGYDASNRLISLSNSWGHSFGFNYDQANRLIQITRPGSSSTFSYTAGGAIASIQHLQGATVKSFADYSYDLRNYPIQKRTLAGDFNYGYDPNGQLTSVSGIQSENFAYDALGNRITDENGNYVYDSTSQRLTEDWQYNYQYDLNGNLISKIPKNQNAKAYQYVYSSKNQLIQVRVLASSLGAAEKDIFFTYDVLGRRMEKKVIDTMNSAQSYSRRYVYDRDNIIAEYDGNNSLLAKYTHSPLTADDILSANFTADAVSTGLSSATGSVYYLKDALGSVTEIVNSSGNVVQSYQYSGFGKLVSIKNGSGIDVTANAPVKTSSMFTGREFDQESGLYYYRARYYDPGIGRFLQKDPHPGKLGDPLSVINRYAYANNSPTMYTDPNGRLAFLAIIAIAALIGGSLNAYNASKEGINGWGLVSAFVNGAGSAALGVTIGVATGGLGGAMLGGAVGGGALNMTNQLSTNGWNFSKLNWTSIAISSAFGAGAAGVGYGVGYGLGKIFADDATQVIGNEAGYINSNNTAAQMGDLTISTTIENVAPTDSGLTCSEAINCMSIKLPLKH